MKRFCCFFLILTVLSQLTAKEIDRSAFLPESLKSYADMDSSLPLPDGGRIPSKSEIDFVLNSISTFSNPKVLIIGNNAGYCASLFAEVYKRVYLIETSKNSEFYTQIFESNGHTGINAYYGNNYDYFSTQGPFDIIFIQGGVSTVTNLFTDQLKNKGELLVPIQDSHGFQQLLKYRKSGSEFFITSIGNTFFRVLY